MTLPGRYADGCRPTPHQAHATGNSPTVIGAAGPQHPDALAADHLPPGTQGPTTPIQRAAERTRGHRNRQVYPAAYPGQPSPRQRRPPKHRVRRQRMPREGMLIQRQSLPSTAVHAADRRGRLVDAIFCQQEDAHNYFLLMQSLIESCGRPVALYTDRHGVFRHTPGSGLPGMPTQFSRAMEELGIQMIFALSPQQLPGHRTPAGTRVAFWKPKQFLPHQRFGVPPHGACIPASGPRAASADPVLQAQEKSGQDNTVRFQLHTLQLLPGPEHPSYAGAAVEVLESHGRLSMKAASSLPRKRRPTRYSNGSGRSTPVPVPPSGANGLGEPWTTTLGPLDKGKVRAKRSLTPWPQPAEPKAAAARKPTFLQKERWNDSESQAQGHVAAGNERDLGINRATVRKYLDSEGPPTRPPRAGPTMSASDTMAT